MAGKIKHFKRRGFSIVQGGVKVKVSLKRFEEQYQAAQTWLDFQIMMDMIPFMPHQTGTFINVTNAMSTALAGSGLVVAAAPPTGRFLYMGKVMVDPETNSPWARKGAKKVVTERPLKYGKNAARPEWFEAAKKAYGNTWVKGVKERAGGG